MSRPICTAATPAPLVEPRYWWTGVRGSRSGWNPDWDHPDAKWEEMDSAYDDWSAWCPHCRAECWEEGDDG